MQDEKSPLRNTEAAADGEEEGIQMNMLNSPDGSQMLSPTMSERVSVTKQNGDSGMRIWQMSPRGNKTRQMKKTSSMNNYHAHNGAAINSSARDGYQTENQKQLYQVDTEKLLLSNDKMTISDLWKTKPQPTFPSFLLERLDLQRLQDEANSKAGNLQKKIEKRKLQEKQKEEEKV